MRHKPALILACSIINAFGMMATGLAHAEKFRWNGIVTQGLFHTDHYNVYGKSNNDISLDFTEVSLNASYSLPNALRLSGQLVYRHAGAGFDNLNLDYLFLDKQIWHGNTFRGGFRIGRIKNIFGLYNDTRDIAFTRPSIYLPHSIYQDLTLRDTLLLSDGASIYLRRIFTNHSVSFEIGGGDMYDENISNLSGTYPYNIIPMEFDGDTNLFSRALFSSNDDRLKIALSNTLITGINSKPIFDSDYYQSLFGLQIEATSANNAISLEYIFGKWIISAEYATEKITLKTDPASFEFLLDETELRSKGYNLQIVRILNSKVSLFSRFDYFCLDTSDCRGQQFEEKDRGVAHSAFAKDYGIGIRWKPTFNMLINFEYHYIDGTGWLSSIENPTLPINNQRYWNLIAATISYRF